MKGKTGTAYKSQSHFSAFFKNFPPKNKIVMRVLENKNLFAGHEIDYMENNTKTPIKDNSYYEIEKEIEKNHLKKAKKKSDGWFIADEQFNNNRSIDSVDSPIEKQRFKNKHSRDRIKKEIDWDPIDKDFIEKYSKFLDDE